MAGLAKPKNLTIADATSFTLHDSTRRKEQVWALLDQALMMSN